MSALTCLLVAGGGAVGTALGMAVLRRPSPLRIALGSAAVSGALGALTPLLHSPRLIALVSFGVLGSAASMVAVGTAGSDWLSRDSIVASMLVAMRKLALHCAVAVSFALLGYLALRGGLTLYVKFVR